MKINKKIPLICFMILVSVLLMSCTKGSPANNTAAPQEFNNTKSLLIDNVISNDWSESKIKDLLGASDSSFLYYDIYFNKGFDIRYANTQVFNIVFHQNYVGEILPGLNMQASIQQVMDTFGVPQFQDKSLDLIGYKEDNYYIFFVGKDSIKEVSIYRRDMENDKNSLVNMIDEYEKTKYDEGFSFIDMAERYLGPYDLSSFGGCQVEIALYSSGLMLYFQDPDAENTSLEITVYGNYEGYISPDIYLPDDSNAVNQINSEYFSFALDKDLIFEKEKDRINQVDDGMNLDRTPIISALSPDGKKKVCLWGEPGMDWTSIGIQYLDRSQADFTLDYNLYYNFIEDGIFWINDRNIIFSCYNTIYIYDLKGSTLKSFDVNNWVEVEILSVNNGEIAYRNFADSEDQHTYKIPYKVNENGEAFFDN